MDKNINDFVSQMLANFLLRIARRQCEVRSEHKVLPYTFIKVYEGKRSVKRKHSDDSNRTFPPPLPTAKRPGEFASTRTRDARRPPTVSENDDGRAGARAAPSGRRRRRHWDDDEKRDDGKNRRRAAAQASSSSTRAEPRTVDATITVSRSLSLSLAVRSLSLRRYA